MKAIVLTYDKHHPMANLCIASYERRWPDNPLEFIVPYQNAPHPAFGERRRSAIRFVQTPAPIVGTMAKLLEGIDADEWVYWCMDDGYVVDMDTETVARVHAQVTTLTDRAVICVRLIPSSQPRGSRAFVQRASSCVSSSLPLIDDPGSSGTRFRLLWQHQFVRAGALRRVFESFPREPLNPKEMDSFLHVKLESQRILEVTQPALSLGESTSRGKIVANCLIAFRQYGLEIPGGFEFDLAKVNVRGELPLRFLGLCFYLSRNWKLRWGGFLLRWYGFLPWRL